MLAQPGPLAQPAPQGLRALPARQGRLAPLALLGRQERRAGRVLLVPRGRRGPPDQRVLEVQQVAQAQQGLREHRARQVPPVQPVPPDLQGQLERQERREQLVRQVPLGQRVPLEQVEQ